MSVLAIIAIVLCAFGVLACFVPRFPAVLASFAGLSCAWFAGHFDGATILFWGIAAALVLGIGVFAPREKALTRRGNPYIVVGAIAGTLVGFVAAPTVAAVITGSVIGAALGALAFRSTPRGPRSLPLFAPVFINFLCSMGLRAVVACSICGITVATLL